MLYVQQSLTPGEELLHVGHFHWLYTLSAILWILWGVLGAVLVLGGAIYIKGVLGYGGVYQGMIEAIRALHPAIRIGAFLILVFGLLKFATMMIIRATTEMAVTTSRIVYKRGLVARYVGEMSIDRIEGINVLQSVWGRILNYGRLMVRGMGVGEVTLPTIADPIAFRRAIERAKIK